MKKRIAALALCLIVLCPVLFAGATPLLCTVCIENNYLDMKDATMPERIGGDIYLPYTVFTGQLGLKSSYNESAQLFVLYNFDYILTFDLARGFAYDEMMNSYKQKAYTVNGILYVPARFVASKFGFLYSYLNTTPLATIRIRSSSNLLSDYLFSSVATSAIEATYAKYLAEKEAAAQPPDPSVPPSQPEDPPAEEPIVQNVYLTFNVAPGDALGPILDTLKEYEYRATFFFEPDDLAARSDEVRRTFGEEHSVGLLLSSTDADVPAALTQALREGNDVLKRLLSTRTRLMRIIGGSEPLTDEALDTLVLGGYRLWDDTFSAEGNDARTMAANVRRAIARSDAPSYIRFGTDATTAAALPTILNYLERSRHQVLPIGEWDTPVNFHQEIR